METDIMEVPTSIPFVLVVIPPACERPDYSIIMNHQSVAKR